MLTTMTLSIEVMDDGDADRELQAALRSTRGRETLIIDPIQAAVRAYLQDEGYSPKGWVEVWADVGERL